MSSDPSIYAVEFEEVTKRFGTSGMVNSLKSGLDRLKSFRFSKRHAVQNSTFTALKHLSFKIQKGERVGFIGRNGCGKSTTLKLVQGVMRPSHGSVKINGEVGGLIELTAGFMGDLTAEENVYIGGALMGLNRIQVDEIVDSVFDLAELEPFRGTAFKNFSSGMKVRLGFCLAMASVPDIVLLDEVLAVGDSAFRRKSMKMVEDYLDGRTLLFVSHSMSQVERLCERVIVLEKGRKVFDGDPKQAVQVYEELNSTGKASAVPPQQINKIPGANKRGIHQKPPVELKKVAASVASKCVKIKVELKENYPLKGNELKVMVSQVSAGNIKSPIGGKIISLTELPNNGVIEYSLDSEHLLSGNYHISIVCQNPNASKDCEKTAANTNFTIALENQPKILIGPVNLDFSERGVTP